MVRPTHQFKKKRPVRINPSPADNRQMLNTQGSMTSDKPIRILAVYDAPESRENLELYLDHIPRFQLTLKQTDRNAETLETTILEESFDLIVLDIHDGQGSLGGLFSAYGECPIVLLTDGEDPPDKRETLGRSVADILSRDSLTPELFRRAVETAITHRSEETRFPQGGETLLVVDDEDAVVDVTCEMLRKLGYQILKAYDGSEAVELYSEHRAEIDGVILDLNMPMMDGEECMQRLLSIDPELVIFVATARLVTAHQEEVLRSGARDIIQKPFLFEDLARRLRDALDSPPVHRDQTSLPLAF